MAHGEAYSLQRSSMAGDSLVNVSVKRQWPDTNNALTSECGRH